MKKNNKKKRRKKKKKIRKGFVSAAAFILAAVVVVFCIYHIVYKTDFFMLKGVDIEGLSSYTEDYIVDACGIVMGEKIFTVDREYIKLRLEQEIYIKEARVLYELPDRLYIKVTERQETYQIQCGDKYVITDEDGIVMNVYDEKSQLLTIESLTDVIYNIGDNIKFEGVGDSGKVFGLINYIDEYGEGVINSEFTVAKNDSAILDTEYGVQIKIDLDVDVGYQFSAALSIISDRLANNLTVANGDTIDFTKISDGTPVYVTEENPQLEDDNG